VEGLAAGGGLHLTVVFVDRDAFRGYCTPGQISAAGLLAEARRGWPSAITADLGAEQTELSDEEIRERMSGNLCRCAAYPNIVAAIGDAYRGDGAS
jgi:xanthine dehydrogenase YagT iron-sulfur-binding subunit